MTPPKEDIFSKIPGLHVVEVGRGEPIVDIESEKYPIILEPKELEYALMRGSPLCIHRWKYRHARDVGQLKVVYNDHVDICNFPSGRICKKCGAIQFVAKERKEDGQWQQEDFTPDG